ncbi:esterase/lipase family protein [Streptomyces sp. NPDC086091]|uniref:esterase/lipase family protein n=1 Tax=Streptomyces sp. NPDC086091 TaxID=3365751 RepID=UPI00381FD67B
MQVTRALEPILPICRRLLPKRLTDLSTPFLSTPFLSAPFLNATLLKATALEIAILAGHLVLYPSGIVQERRDRPGPSDRRHGTTGDTPGHGESAAATAPHSPTASAPPTASVASATSASAGTPDAPARLPAPPPAPPVVLLHGFIDNRSVFVLLRRSLAQHGRHRVESLNYSPLTCDIRSAAELLGRHIEEICERAGADRVDIVGHSLGGLIARYYVQRLGGDTRVRTLVTLGTPHEGTRVAPLANAHPIVRQMRPGSAVIEELALPASGCRTRFVSFWSDLDHLMVPLETARLDHPDLVTENVQVSGVGHLALPVHPAVATGIRRALDPEDAVEERVTAAPRAASEAASGAASGVPSTAVPAPAVGAGGLTVA